MTAGHTSGGDAPHARAAHHAPLPRLTRRRTARRRSSTSTTTMPSCRPIVRRAPAARRGCRGRDRRRREARRVRAGSRGRASVTVARLADGRDGDARARRRIERHGGRRDEDAHGEVRRRRGARRRRAPPGAAGWPDGRACGRARRARRRARARRRRGAAPRRRRARRRSASLRTGWRTSSTPAALRRLGRRRRPASRSRRRPRPGVSPRPARKRAPPSAATRMSARRGEGAVPAGVARTRRRGRRRRAGAPRLPAARAALTPASPARAGERRVVGASAAASRTSAVTIADGQQVEQVVGDRVQPRRLPRRARTRRRRSGPRGSGRRAAAPAPSGHGGGEPQARLWPLEPRRRGRSPASAERRERQRVVEQRPGAGGRCKASGDARQLQQPEAGRRRPRRAPRRGGRR